MICRKEFFLAGLTLCITFCSLGQTVISAKNGSWTDPSTWIGEEIPSPSNATSVIIQHDVHLNASVNSPTIEVRGSLDILSSGALTILPPDGISGSFVVSTGRFSVSGRLIGRDGISYTTSITNTHFNAGGIFQFDAGPKGNIPTAAWNIASTLLITGFRGSGYIALAYANQWRQPFGNVEYNCPLQSTFVDFNGHLRNIQGDFIIRSTNGQALRLSTTQKPTINVKGNFIVEGRSALWLTTTSDSAVVNIGKDFRYSSTSTAPSYFTTRGRCHFSVDGQFILDSSGALRICSGSADSTGVRRTTFFLGGDLHIRRGSLISPAPGRGKFVFRGTEIQRIIAASGMFNGNFEYHVYASSSIDLGTSSIGGTGNLLVKGRISLGSTHSMGAIQLSGGGNILNVGRRSFYNGSTIEYNGTGVQYVGVDNPTDSLINLECNTNGTLRLLKSLTSNHLDIGYTTITTNNFRFTSYGNVSAAANATFNNEVILSLKGGKNQQVDLAAVRVDELLVSKRSGTRVDIVTPLSIIKSLRIERAGNKLYSHGNITLLSTNDIGSTASVSSLPNGSSIEGDVTVQRYMSGEGKIYRYIASPVVDASVADLKDDFPVTGTFSDPSTGRGLNRSGPSLFFFDTGIVNWKPYPTSGFASENFLTTGLGYAAFVREASRNTILDFTGVLNQGRIELPVSFNELADADDSGWNLVGNPYAASINWASSEGWEKSPDISDAIAIRDNSNGTFKYSDGEVGDLVNGNISSGQAFWVRCSAADPFLIVNEAAKSQSDAEFFRTSPKEIDHLSVTVSGGNVQDRTYLRTKSNASDSLDLADAIKKRNPSISLSFMTSDSVPVAINAMQRVGCFQELPLILNLEEGLLNSPLRDSVYTISVASFGLFKSAEITLYDKFLEQRVVGEQYSFTITKDPESYNKNRFVLLIELSDNLIPTIELLPRECRDSVVNIKVHSVNDGESYFALGKNNVEIAIDGTTNIISLPVLQGDSVEEVTILRKNFCSTKIIDTIGIEPNIIPPPPAILSATRCPTVDNIVLKRDTAHAHFKWYELESDTVPLFVSSDTVMIGGELMKKNYFISASTGTCESDRIKVQPREADPVSLQIYETGWGLESNYPCLWFTSDKALTTDSTTIFEIPVAGYYTAAMSKSGCTYAHTLYSNGAVLAITDVESDSTINDLLVYPVPFQNFVELKSRSVVKELKIYSVEGRLVLNSSPKRKLIRLDTHGWGKGIYVVVLKVGDTIKRMRITK